VGDFRCVLLEKNGVIRFNERSKCCLGTQQALACNDLGGSASRADLRGFCMPHGQAKAAPLPCACMQRVKNDAMGSYAVRASFLPPARALACFDPNATAAHLAAGSLTQATFDDDSVDAARLPLRDHPQEDVHSLNLPWVPAGRLSCHGGDALNTRHLSRQV
jgi:hypothetical protein